MQKKIFVQLKLKLKETQREKELQSEQVLQATAKI